MTFIFRNMTIFWYISKWNRGQKKWNGESNNDVANSKDMRMQFIDLLSR